MGGRGGAAAPVGELCRTLARVLEEGASSRCRLIKLGQINELPACRAGGPQPLGGDVPGPGGLLWDGPPVSLLTRGLEGTWFWERGCCCSCRS